MEQAATDNTLVKTRVQIRVPCQCTATGAHACSIWSTVQQEAKEEGISRGWGQGCCKELFCVLQKDQGAK